MPLDVAPAAATIVAVSTWETGAVPTVAMPVAVSIVSVLVALARVADTQ